MSDGQWWRLDMTPEELAQREEQQRQAFAAIDRRWNLLRANRARKLKIWNPWENASETWLATWMENGTPASARYATEDEMLTGLSERFGVNSGG